MPSNFKDMPRIKVGVSNMYILRYSDDTGLIAYNDIYLQGMLDRAIKENEITCLFLNRKKKETMVISKKMLHVPTCNIVINGTGTNS